jgi:F0F1-type ATP synthase, alpha subunit
MFSTNESALKDLGLVISVSDGIVGIKGLDNVANGEVIDFLTEGKKVAGMVWTLNLTK